jgi:hypothetical protein
VLRITDVLCGAQMEWFSTREVLYGRVEREGIIIMCDEKKALEHSHRNNGR